MNLLVTVFITFSVLLHAHEAPERLSETGLYRDTAKKNLGTESRFYSPAFPLWSDGLLKTRFIRLPDRARIDSSDMDHWVFPVGTELWKNFIRDYRYIETRYMRKNEDGSWTFATYVWNEDGSDAVKAPKDGIKSYWPIGGDVRHDIPGVKDCLRCHGTEKGDPVIGFSALQLSETSGSLTLEKLRSRLTHYPSHPPKIMARTDQGRSAIGYLHGNCGHCHNPGGSAGFTGLYLRHEGDVGDEKQEPAYQTAVRQPSSFEVPGRQQGQQIEPGEQDFSAIFLRMDTVARGARMPPLGSKVVDPNGLHAIGQWIRELGH